MKVLSNTVETRITEPRTIEVGHFGFAGVGAFRDRDFLFYGLNAGNPGSLPKRAYPVDGMVSGVLKVTRLRHTVGSHSFYSVRVLRGTVARTFYVRGDALVVVDGKASSMDTAWVTFKG